VKSEQLIKDVHAIREAHPENLMVRYFDGEWFSSLGKPEQERLLNIIATGLKNPDSQMGAYAMRPDDYALFAPLFDPMIRDFHSIPPDTKIKQVSDWNFSGIQGDLSAIDQRLADTSMRVRVARNVAAYPLPGAMSRDERLSFEALAVEAFSVLMKDPGFGGQYLSLTPGSPHQMSEREYTSRVQAHQMFKDMSADRYLNAAGISADWPHGRGMYVSEQEDFLVWVGEEDHLRIMAMRRGGDLKALFTRLHGGLEKLEHLLPPFAMSPTYGALNSCPTNLGAGMRASLHLKLPSLTQGDADLKRLKLLAQPLGLVVRGAAGEHSGAGEGGLVDISPNARLGVSEKEILNRLYQGTKTLWAAEIR